MVAWGPPCPPDGNVHTSHCPKYNDQDFLQQKILGIDTNVRNFQLQQVSLKSDVVVVESGHYGVC